MRVGQRKREREGERKLYKQGEDEKGTHKRKKRTEEIKGKEMEGKGTHAHRCRYLNKKEEGKRSKTGEKKINAKGKQPNKKLMNFLQVENGGQFHLWALKETKSFETMVMTNGIFHVFNVNTSSGKIL